MDILPEGELSVFSLEKFFFFFLFLKRSLCTGWGGGKVSRAWPRRELVTIVLEENSTMTLYTVYKKHGEWRMFTIV